MANWRSFVCLQSYDTFDLEGFWEWQALAPWIGRLWWSILPPSGLALPSSSSFWTSNQIQQSLAPNSHQNNSTPHHKIDCSDLLLIVSTKLNTSNLHFRRLIPRVPIKNLTKTKSSWTYHFQQSRRILLRPIELVPHKPEIHIPSAPINWFSRLHVTCRSCIGWDREDSCVKTCVFRQELHIR
jgi:hypothetical protein